VSESYVSRLRTLTYAAIGIFGAYIVSFGIAYSRGGGYFALLPIFGTGAMLMIWVAAIYTLSQLRPQPAVVLRRVLSYRLRGDDYQIAAWRICAPNGRY
jgi:ATP phosphoribosyltransferase regulatory subunit HisZ